MKPPDPSALFWDMAQLEDPVLGYDELARTPRATREALLGTGLIVPGNTARSLVCEACMTGHAEEVESVTRPNGVTQHFIYCPENGRIEVNPDRLRQWTPRYDVVAGFIAESLGTTGDCRPVIPGRLWDLGRVVAGGHSYHAWVARRLTTDLRPHLPGDGASVLFALGARPRDDLGTAPERVFEVRHLMHIEDGKLCFDANAVRAHLAGCAVTARQECAQAVPPAALQALHADVRQIMDQTAPLPAAVAKVGKDVEAVYDHVRGVPALQLELAEARVVPEALALEIQNRVAGLLSVPQQEIWRAMRNAGGVQTEALPVLRERGVVGSAPTLNRRVREIDEILRRNGLPPCSAYGPAVRYRTGVGPRSADGGTMAGEVSAVEHDWAEDPAERETTIRSYLAASPADREHFHQTKPGIEEEADEFLTRRR